MLEAKSLLISICVVVFLFILQGTVAVYAKENRPNVLFIVIDDLNDWVGHLGGHPNVKTPNIDQLAKRGISFTNAHVPAASCNASRSAVLSGLRPSTTGIYTNRQDSLKILENVTTLTQYFMAHGYRVLGGGKVFHGGKFNSKDYFNENYHAKKRGLPVPKSHYNGLNLKGKFDWKALDIPDHEMPDYNIVTWAAKKLNEEYDQPLFLAVGINKPHLPWYIPKKYYAMYPKNVIVLPETKKDDLADIPEIGREMAAPERDHKPIVEAQRWHDAVQAYLASITFADAQLGRLIEALDRSPNAGNTIIVLWSDHGLHLGEKMRWRKSTLWEETTRVPFIVVAPDVTKPGMLSPRPVDYMSIYPTLADLCGLPIPEHVQGVSLRPLFEDPNASWNRIALTTSKRGNHAVRTDRWRYIRYRDGTEELYDHTNDPMEWHNLAQFADFSKFEELHDHTNGPIEWQNQSRSAEISKIKEQMAKWIPVIETKNAPLKSRFKR